jgi:hypothetical protein
MDNIAGIPYTEAAFDKDGKLLNNPKLPDGNTDLIVISHGWLNNQADAERLYTDLMTNFVKVTQGDAAIHQRKLATIGVLWPSKQLDLAMTQPVTSTKQAGGAASVGEVEPVDVQQAMNLAIDRAAQVFDEPDELEQLEKLRSLTPQLEDDVQAQVDFIEALRKMLDPDRGNASMQSSDDASDKFFEGNPQDIFTNARLAAPASAADPVLPESPVSGDQAVGEGTGRAASFVSVMSGAANAVANLLNLTTYFKMKMRAGTVGSKGVAPLIDRVASQVERIHLVGHSFGGRLVTAAVSDSQTSKIHSMSLLQAAFSHNGFSRSRNGFFRRLIDEKRVAGPVLITLSKFDRSVGLAYPAASRINGDKTQAFGGADDQFGGIGSNGAQHMDEGEIFDGAPTMLDVGEAYQLKGGKLHNLESSAFIVDPVDSRRDAHGFVYVPQVAWAISRALIF